MHPPPNAQQQREEALKREEARKEEQERKALEIELYAFDAHVFYELLRQWAAAPLPRPIPQTIRVTPLRQRVVMHQPLPISRRGLADLRRLLGDCSRLLSLLRAIDQKGIECPYVHRANREILELAVDKCAAIERASRDYLRGQGLWAKIGQLLNGSHLRKARETVEVFKHRLEAILMMCRHQEFAEDLQRLRSSMLSRAELGASAPVPKPPEERSKEAEVPMGVFVPRRSMKRK